MSDNKQPDGQILHTENNSANKLADAVRFALVIYGALYFTALFYGAFVGENILNITACASDLIYFAIACGGWISLFYRP